MDEQCQAIVLEVTLVVIVMRKVQDPHIKKKEDEPNWLKLSRQLDEQYEKSRSKPMLLTREEVAAQMEARYGPNIAKKKK